MKKILVFLAVVVFFLSCNNDNRLYRIQENGLYGFIDSVGNVVIKPQYRYVGGFSKEGLACVVSNVKITKNENLSSSRTLDSTGKEEIMDSCICITYGYIDRENKMVIDTTNQICLPICEIVPSDNGLMVKYAKEYINRELSFRSNMMRTFAVSDGLFIYQDEKSKLYGYKDIEGKIKIEAKYLWCHNFSNGVAIVICKSKNNSSIDEMLNRYSVIDKNGNVLASGYSHIEDYTKNGLTWAMVASFQGKEIVKDWVQLDKSGKIKNGPLSFYGIEAIYNNDEYPICVLNDFVYGYVFTFLDENGHFLSDFDNDGTLLIDCGIDGKRSELFGDVIPFSMGVAGVKGYNSNGESAWYFVDKTLFPISEPYDSILYVSNGIAAVKKLEYIAGIRSHLGEWGFVKVDTVNKKLTQFIPFKFSECGNFYGELAYFRKKGTVFDVEGYINQKGEIVWQTKLKSRQLKN